jgi:hypothetical protein
MSWLSQGLQDIGLGGLNTFWDSAIKPVLDNPIVDVGLGLGATALTGGLLAPELGALFGAGDIADIAGGAAAGGGDALSFGAAPASLSAADASVAPLGFAGDVGATGDLTSFLGAPGAATSGFGDIAGGASPIAAATPGGYAPGGFALSTGLTNATPVGGLPDFSATLPDLGSPDAAFSGYADPTAGAGAASPGDLVNISGSAGTPGAAAPTAAPGQGGFAQSFTNALNPSTIGSSVGKALANPLTDIGIAGLGYNIYSGYEEKQAINSATNLAKQEAATAAQTGAQANAAAQPFIVNGENLTQYLSTGTLPQDWQAQVTQAVNGAKAQIIQGYASRGMSTDPNQNSALAQDLANVDLQSNTLTASLESTLSTAGNQMVTTANGLLQTGLSAAQISAELPAMMLQLTNTMNASTAQALAGFASAVGKTGQGGQLTLNVNPSTGAVTA